MHPVPRPHVLDPDRDLDNDRGDFTADHVTRAALLQDALKVSCSYGQQLWSTLDDVRRYLFESLPPDPRSPGPHPRAGASPTGPDDDAGWDNWIATYSSVTSALCGPQGDSGYGLHEARRAAQDRRSAPNLRLSNDHPELRHDRPELEAEPTVAQASRIGEPSPHRPAHRVAVAVLVVMAVRGLRPRSRRSSRSTL
jgi:hypothetical protein